MKSYKILKGWYNEVTEETLIIPKDMKLLYRNGSIGNFCHTGHNHYLGCLKNPSDEVSDSIMNNRCACHYYFGNLQFFIFSNIKFVDETPKFYTSEEFLNEFELDKYCIEFQTEGYYKTNKELITSYKGHPIINLDFANWVDGKTTQIYKITKIEGPYDVRVFRVQNHSEITDTEYYSIEEITRIDLSRFCESYKNSPLIYKNDDSKFENMIKNVLNRAYIKN